MSFRERERERECKNELKTREIEDHNLQEWEKERGREGEHRITIEH